MIYELWDTESNNLVGDYDTEEAALQVVRTSMMTLGRQAILRLALGVEDDRGQTRQIARGERLAELAGRPHRLARPA